MVYKLIKHTNSFHQKVQYHLPPVADAKTCSYLTITSHYQLQLVMVMAIDIATKYLHMYSTEQCLASSKILTPTPSPPSEKIKKIPPLMTSAGTHSVFSLYKLMVYLNFSYGYFCIYIYVNFLCTVQVHPCILSMVINFAI